MEHPTSNHAVDVTDHFDAKLAALLCHASQHPDQSWIESVMRDKSTAAARDYALGEGRLAERFAVYPLP